MYGKLNIYIGPLTCNALITYLYLIIKRLQSSEAKLKKKKKHLQYDSKQHKVLGIFFLKSCWQFCFCQVRSSVNLNNKISNPIPLTNTYNHLTSPVPCSLISVL